MLVLLGGFGVQARSEPAPIDATVVWRNHERAYIAFADSAALRPGDLVTFLERGRPIAWGSITNVVGNELSVARLTAGTLARVKRLDRLKILSERPPLRPPPVLRVGLPAGGRGNLLFACDSLTFRTPQPPAGFRTDTLSERSFRLVRETSDPLRPWPDTLLVRLFEESADQEIALERGDIDVAVFWPGELSSYIRAAPRWQDFSSGMPERGVVSAGWFAPAVEDTIRRRTPGRDPRIAMLETELFHGDLVPWESLNPADTSSHTALPDPARFEVDASIPGREMMERVLNRGRPPQRDRVPAVRLFYLDAPIDSVVLARGVADYVATHRLASRLGAGSGDVLHVAHLFAVRCPLLCAPEFRPYLSAFGAGAMVDLLPCVRTRP